MSLFGLMGEMEDDPFFGNHMRTMRQMNNMMNSLFADPFGMMAASDFGPRAIANHHHNSLGNMHHHNSLMPFAGFPDPMQNINRLLSGSLDSLGDHHSSFSSSSTVISMSSGPDGRPQVYKATSSTRVAPGGIKETQQTMSDSRTGTKKMAIGHHIGERAHIIEREQNVHSGDREERQDFINLEEDEAPDFNREWETKTRSRSEIPRITGGYSSRHNRHSYGGGGNLPAITAGPSRRNRDRVSGSFTSPRRAIRSTPLVTLPTSSSSSMAANRSPYNPPGQHQHTRKHKSNLKTVSGSSPSSSPTSHHE